MIPLLAGTRILELSAVVMGPFAGQILADLGAEVIKVCATGGVFSRGDTPGQQQLTEEELREAVRAVGASVSEVREYLRSR